MAAADRQLTEESPECGIVTAFDKTISLAEHWLEGGVHVLRSVEFDVIAGDEDFQAAIDQFAEKAEDLWIYLSKQERLTENENETFMLLADRFLEIYKLLEQREVERREEQQRQRRRLPITINFNRPRGEHPLRNWRPQSIPNSASQLSHA